MGWLATDKQHRQAKMPAAGATQAHSAVGPPVGGNKLWPLQDSKNLWAGGQENYQKPKQTILNYLKMIAIAN